MGLDRMDICPQHAFPAHGVDQPELHAGQLNVRREQVNALTVMQNTAAVRDGGIVDHILHDVCQRNGQLIRLRVAEGEGQRALCICINEQHPLVLPGKPDAEIGGGRGFAYTTLLIRHRDHFAIRHMGFPPSHKFSRLRRSRRLCNIRNDINSNGCKNELILFR